MQATRTASRVRHYAGLGMMANKAHYGLQYFTENDKKIDEGVKKYLQDGIELCKRLVEGEETKKRGTINTVNQLAAFDDIKPPEVRIAVENGKPEEVLETFQMILQEESTQAMSDQRLLEAQRFLLEVSDAYTVVAFSELEDLEKPSD
jgi:hypothetical protein